MFAMALLSSSVERLFPLYSAVPTASGSGVAAAASRAGVAASRAGVVALLVPE